MHETSYLGQDNWGGAGKPAYLRFRDRIRRIMPEVISLKSFLYMVASPADNITKRVARIFS